MIDDEIQIKSSPAETDSSPGGVTKTKYDETRERLPEHCNSVCAKPGSHNTLYWYPQSGVPTIESAFKRYVAPRFFRWKQAVRAFAEFEDVLKRAKRGNLRPIYEVRTINPATTMPEIIYEIKTHWNNAQRSIKTSGYIGARLFYGEPEEKPNTVICVYLMCKVEHDDNETGWLVQTAAAKKAAFRFDECRRNNWDMNELSKI
ncbi:hypothetical protein OZX67_07495 [Bifidobacterium sp. ESL0728]|uniref:hypothetical protein n=1 Tax=Bifidobacterium sp. ESL0728 TaxID=2983220 RepID=UPI0023F84FB6|nr:hypothetical protein [Bifidobacterium sp. ESL0728]WEV58638.1 hypothetical protein OZX67_07495 [Bifidobacterium sp. ESL0728]